MSPARVRWVMVVALVVTTPILGLRPAVAGPLVGTDAPPVAVAAADRATLPASAIGTHGWPVDGAVVAPWDPPATPYGPGHRGVDLAVAVGDPVRASAGGTVGFAGVVAGVAWVSIDHAHGVRTTVGPMATMAVGSGDQVARSSVVGTAGATAHAGARTPRTGRLHWSARLDGTYVDPAPLVGRLVATLLPASPEPPPDAW